MKKIIITLCPIITFTIVALATHSQPTAMICTLAGTICGLIQGMALSMKG